MDGGNTLRVIESLIRGKAVVHAEKAGEGLGGGGVLVEEKEREIWESRLLKKFPNLFTVSKRLNQLNTQETAIG